MVAWSPHLGVGRYCDVKVGCRSPVSWSTVSRILYIVSTRRHCIWLRFVLMSYLFNSSHFFKVKFWYKKKSINEDYKLTHPVSYITRRGQWPARGTRGSDIMAGVGVPIFLSPTIGESVSILWWVHDTMLQYHNNIMSCHYTNEMEICMSCSCCITYRNTNLLFIDSEYWNNISVCSSFFSFTSWRLFTPFCVLCSKDRNRYLLGWMKPVDSNVRWR